MNSVRPSTRRASQLRVRPTTSSAPNLRMTASMDAYLVTAPASPMTSRLSVIASVGAHALMIMLVLLAVWGQVTAMPLHVVAPLPPPVPEAPPVVTDARVFPNAPSLYSSLPLKMRIIRPK